MTQYLRALSALAESLGLFFSTHSYNHQKLLFQAIWKPSSGFHTGKFICIHISEKDYQMYILKFTHQYI